MFGLENIVGGLFNFGNEMYENEHREEAATQEYHRQKEFAKNQIKWRANDARDAGLHPLAALGAQTMNYTPSHVGQTPGQGMGQIGQGIGKGIEDLMMKKQRKEETAYSRRMRELSITREEQEARKNEAEIGILEWELEQAKIAPKGATTDDRTKAPLAGQDDGAVQMTAPPQFKTQSPGLMAGKHPAAKVYQDRMDRAHIVPADSEAFSDENVFAQLKYHGFQAADWASIVKNPDSRQSHKMVQKKRPKAPKGMEYQYDLRTNTYYLVDPRREGSGMYYYPEKTRQWLNKSGIKVKRYPYWVTPLKKLR